MVGSGSLDKNSQKLYSRNNNIGSTWETTAIEQFSLGRQSQRTSKFGAW